MITSEFLLSVPTEAKRRESAAGRGAEAKPSTAEFQRAPKTYYSART